MPASLFLARVRVHVLQLTVAVPEGKGCSHQSMGEFLDVMPRHGAYILSRSGEAEKFVYPWHRVVGGEGEAQALLRLARWSRF